MNTQRPTGTRALFIASVAACALAAAAGTSGRQSEATGTTNPLAPLAWLEGKWQVESEVAAGGKILRESYYEWSPNQRALRFWTFVTRPGAQRTAVADGWYAWDPAEKKIRFGFVDPDGFYSGEAVADPSSVAHNVTAHHSSGQTVRWRSTLERTVEGSMLVKMFAEREGQWAEIASLVVQRSPSEK